MALAAKQNEGVEMKSRSADTVTMPRPRRQTSTMDERENGVEQAVQDYAGRATDILETAKESARKAYDQVRTQASQGYSRVVAKGKEVGRRTQNRARLVKEKHPLQLIAIIAGAAFVAGIAIRIWRSRAS